MTQNIHAACELVEREMEQIANVMDGQEPCSVANAMMLLPVFTMLTTALDLLQKAIAFEGDSTRKEVIS